MPSRLEIDTPVAGAWVEPGPVTVSGRAVGLSTLLVDGVSVPIVDGRFTTTIEVDAGVTAIEVFGGEADGDGVFERRSVLAGAFASGGARLTDPIAVRVTQEGVDQLVGLAVSAIDFQPFIDQIIAANPVFEGTASVFDYGANLLSFTLGAPVVQLDLADGGFDVHVEIPDVAVRLEVFGGIGPAVLDTEVIASATRVTADLRMTADAGPGGLDARVGPVTLDLVGLYVDTTAIPGTFEDNIPLIKDEIERFVRNTAREQVALLAPTLIDAVQSALSLSFSTDLFERTFSVDAVFRELVVTDGEARLFTDLGLTVTGGDGEARFAGVFDLPDGQHRFPVQAPFAFSLHDDLLNRILFEAWRAGVLKLSIGSDEQPLLGVLLQQLGSPTGTVSVDVKLPPVALEGPEGLELQVGEVFLRIDTPGGTYGEYVVVRVAGRVPVTPRLTNGELGLTVGEPQLSLQVVETDWNASHSTITNLLEDQLPIDVLVGFASAFGFPLPAFAGLVIDSAEVSRGASGVHTAVGVVLAAEAP